MIRPSRHQMWAEAEQTFFRRATSAKFLYGTFWDRQTGALRTHRYRQAFGVRQVAPGDHAELRTRGTDGESRQTTWTRDHHQGTAAFVPMAERIRAGTYKPEALKLARWPKPNGNGFRVVAVPTVQDRTLGAVLLEILEPVIDPVLSPWQHGYRATEVGGKNITVPGFKGVPRGSTRIVALRLLRAVRGGHHHLAEIDIRNAFASVDRKLFGQMLVQGGCSPRFAQAIIRLLGDTAVDPAKEGMTIPVTGIPLGNPVGPLLFNFFVRHVHDRIPASSGIVLTSYADNFFLAAKNEADLHDGIAEVQAVLKDDLGMESKVVQQVDLGEEGQLFTVLERKESGGWVLRADEGSKVHLLGPGGARGQGGPPRTSRTRGSLPGGRDGNGVASHPPVGDLRVLLPEGDGPPVAVPLPDREVRDGGSLKANLPVGSPHVVAVPLGGGDGIRSDPQSGDHRPEGIRYDLEEEAGGFADQYPAPGHLPPAHLDQGDRGLGSDDGGDVVGPEAHADVVFTLDEGSIVEQVARLTGKKRTEVTVMLPAWPEEAGEQIPQHRLVAGWQGLSRRLVGLGVQEVGLRLPRDARLLQVAGLFGRPAWPGADGDDHWRIVGSPRLLGPVIALNVHRRAALDEERRRSVVRSEGVHLVGQARGAGREFTGIVTGVVNVGASRRPFPVIQKRRSPNPSTAVAEALTEALNHLAGITVPITVWMSDELIRAALRGRHLGSVKLYEGVRPPDMDRALRGLVGAAARVPVEVGTFRARKNGAMVTEIVAARHALEHVQAFARELEAVTKACRSSW